MAIYTYTEKPTLHNLPQLLIDAAVQLDYSHEKTIKTALNLWAKKLISYPMVRQNYIPVEIWREMIRNRETLRFNSKWGKHVRGKAVSGRHNFDGCMNPYYGFGIVTTGLHPPTSPVRRRISTTLLSSGCLKPSHRAAHSATERTRSVAADADRTAGENIQTKPSETV